MRKHKTMTKENASAQARAQATAQTPGKTTGQISGQVLKQVLGQTTARRWLLVAMLALATLAMHAVLSNASPAAQAPPGPTGSASGVDFLLPAGSISTPAPPGTLAGGTLAGGTLAGGTLAGGTPAAAPAWNAAVNSIANVTAATTATVLPNAQPIPVQAHSGPVSVSAKLDRQAVLAGSDGRLYAEVVIAGKPSKVKQRLPTDLIVVLDHSSSMSGLKMEQARQATSDLISRLAAEDTFALVAFSNESHIVIERSHATPEARARWQGLVSGVRSGGGTNMLDGLEDAIAVLRRRGHSDRPCRVLLLSDGHPNTTDGLEAKARETSRFGAALSSLGIGADFNETLMGQLADFGTGNYYFLDHAETIASVFAGELENGRSTIARNVRLAFAAADGISLIEAAGYPLERTAEGVIIRPGHIFAGQTRRLWLTLEVDAEQPFANRQLGELDISWSANGEEIAHRLGAGLQVACVSNREQYHAGIDPETWGRAVVLEEYGRLQNEVADFIRSGREQEAKEKIESYVTRQSRQNAYVQNAEVSANLAEIENLRQEVDDVFTGADQAQKQKVLSKRKHEISQQLRRIDEGGQ